MIPILDSQWDDWEKRVLSFIESGNQNDATAEIMRMASHVIDCECSAYGAQTCRRMMNKFAHAFSYWLDDDEDE